MGSAREPSRSGELEALRAEADRQLELVLHSAAALRAELRGFENAIRRVRRHVGRGVTAEEMHDIVDMGAVRESVTQAATHFEAARHAARLSVFRVQLAEGMSIGAIARAWRISRQLVARMLKEERPGPPAAD